MKLISSIGSVILSGLLISSPAFSQAESDWQLPRTNDGHPDLQGVWENNTITPVERPDVFGDKEYLTDEDLVFLQSRIAEIEAAGADAIMANDSRKLAYLVRDSRPAGR